MKVAPSLLSADFSTLTEAIRCCEMGGAAQLHLDVMDGHFVPNISFGPVVIRSMRKRTHLPFDVHLMVESPERYVIPFSEAGANSLTVHVEVCPSPDPIVSEIRACGLQCGVTLRPSTSIDTLRDWISAVDLILVMSVDPGFGGQQFIPSSLERIRQVRRWVDEVPPARRPLISVDGGVTLANAKEIADAGADILVAGSAVFSSADPADTIRRLAAVERTLP